jgi:hypothetical protein
MSEASEHIAKFNAVIGDCELLACMARDSELQRGACSRLRTLLATLVDLKRSAVVDAGDENEANLLLGFECVAVSLHSELQMWLLLKEERPDEAWDALIEAQNAATSAARVHRGFSHVGHRRTRLETIEKLVFPRQVFLSAGWIVGRQECSICGGEYGTCAHLDGKPYMGTLCSIVAKDCRGNHVAIVKHPADKKCRIVSFKVEGGTRNRMTWRVEPTKGGHLEDADSSAEAAGLSERLMCKAIIATAIR